MWWLIVIGIFVLIVACIFFVGRIEDSYSPKKWEQTTAKVVKKNHAYVNDVAAIWGQSTQRDEYQIKYSVNGQTYKRYLPNNTGFRPAGSVRILYNKKHPGRFVVIHGTVHKRKDGKMVIRND
ncbi:MAG: hypothetical protein EOM40_17485 [Clostridia bacterium]|nr:hypothetical protein [Clostridia bacterium]NCC44094.1 hypothetical protein [Clostridia bacterium]